MKTVTTIAGILLLLTTYQAFGQQWYPTYVPHGRDVSAAVILDRNTLVMGAGSEIDETMEDFFITSDYALLCNVFSTGNPTSQVKSIAFSDGLKGFAVHYKGKMSETFDGGNIWSIVKVMNNRNFFKVIYHGVNTLLIAGGTQTKDTAVILKSTDGGVNWTDVYDQPGTWLKSVCFVDSLKGFAVGDSAQILTTTDAGNSWTPMVAPITGRNFNSVVFLNSDTGFIVGGLKDSIRTILKTTNGGTNWTVLKDEVGGGLNDIAFLNSVEGYIVGDSATLLKTTNAGTNWTPQALPNTLDDQYLTTITFYQNTLGLIGGRDGHLYLYSNMTSPQVITDSYTQIDSGQVVLAAKVNTHGTPTRCYFVISDDSTFTSPATRFNEQTITSDSLVYLTSPFNGLIPNTRYYYYCRAENLAGNTVGNTLNFDFGGDRYTFRFDQPGGRIDTTFLTAIINKFSEPVAVTFDYATDLLMQNSVSGFPATVTDTLLHPIAASLGNLYPYTQYYCRMRGTSASRKYFSPTLVFTTGEPFTTYRTLQATSVSDSSAVLNGLMEGALLSSTVYFEYGLDPVFMRNLVYATPAVVNDTLQHLLSVSLNHLLPDTIYYFRLVVKTATGSYSGQELSFYTSNIHTVFETLPPAHVTGYSASLLGQVDQMPLPVSLYFQYGTNSFMQDSVFAIPATVNDSLPHLIQIPVLNLVPYTTYYYRLVGITSSGNFRGDIISFQTGNTTSAFQTEAASGISTNSAILNGGIHNVGLSTNLSFEYGTTTALGNTITANPQTVNDTLQHTVSAALQSLLPNTFYYYRLKGELAGGATLLGNTLSFYTGANPILNWDFQSWHQEDFLLADHWTFFGNDFEQVPGHSGNYALKISNATIAMNGKMIDNAPHQFLLGVPFHARPDSFSVFLNYHFLPGDTGGMFVHLYDDNYNDICTELFPVSGNSGGTFKRISFPLSYNSGLMPDSLIVMFACAYSDLTMPHPDDYMIIDDITPVPATQTIYNGDFENWFSFSNYSLDSWNYAKHQFITDSANITPIVTQATYNPPSDYAAQIQGIKLGGEWVGGELSNINQDVFTKSGGTPIQVRYQTLNGYYKWLPQNSDTMLIDVQMLSQGQIIGNGRFSQTDSVSSFTPFNIPINYAVSGVIPDTAKILFRTFSSMAYGPSTLVIDKISFDGFTGVPENEVMVPSTSLEVFIYPNPTGNRLTVEWNKETKGKVTLTLVSVEGRVVKSETNYPANRKLSIDVADLVSGVYFIEVQSGSSRMVRKVIVAR